MPELIVYATWQDSQLIRTWINGESDVAWIVKAEEHDRLYSWKARSQIEVLAEQDYAIWHIRSGALNIPSGAPHLPDVLVSDPFAGWMQTLDHDGATAPWFGANLPGPYAFRFREAGKEAPGSLGRSGFYWALDRYKSIGKPAHAEAKRWWHRLRRFIARNAAETRWPDPSNGRVKSFVFPDARRQELLGRHRDINP